MKSVQCLHPLYRSRSAYRLLYAHPDGVGVHKDDAKGVAEDVLAVNAIGATTCVSRVGRRSSRWSEAEAEAKGFCFVRRVLRFWAVASGSDAGVELDGGI